MNEIQSMFYSITESPFFSLSLCFLSYSLALYIQAKYKSILLNPLLVATLICISFLLIFKVPYANFTTGANAINMMLSPVTAILAISMYHQREMLKKYFFPAVIGTLVGAGSCIFIVRILIRLFGLEDALFDSIFAKSVTTPIAFGLTIKRGGETSITVAAIMLTGLTGAVFSPHFIKIFRVKDPIAAGIAIGTSSHALGTTRALQIGELEGAMSSIAIGLAGLATVFVSLFI